MKDSSTTKARPAAGGEDATGGAGAAASHVSARAAAGAAFAGFLPLVAINAYFARQVPLQLDLRAQLLHHAYDAAQLIGLAAASSVLVALLARLPRARRVGVACALVFAACYALLGADLESFLERHAGSGVPWRALFAALAAAAVIAPGAVVLLLARRALSALAIAAGLALAVANHLALRLDYPATHFIAALAAAALIGAGALPWTSRVRSPRWLPFGACMLSVIALLAYVVPPGPVVRGALLGSSGAVTAPFVAELWTWLRDADGASAGAGPARDPAWFAPRPPEPMIPGEPLPGAPSAPIVVLLTVDALRADLLHGGGEQAKATRALRAMARRSLSFERAWSPAAYTMASLRSMFTSSYYLQQNGQTQSKLRRAAGQQRKVKERPFLAALLRKHGVPTLNLRTHDVLALGGSVCRGFEEEQNLGERAPSGKVLAALLAALETRAANRLFVYSHILDPHAPYNLAGKRGTPKQRYLGEVGLVDAAIGRLRKELRARGLDRRTYLIVTADHAEAFGEHGHDFHATTMYEEMIHVPLLIEGPGVVPRRVAQAVTGLDLAPTILSLFGAPTPGHYMGQSLVPFMRGDDVKLTRPLAADGGRAIRAMLFDDRWKVIVDTKRGTEELYDLREDPGERTNLAEHAFARPYLDTLHAFFAGMNPKEP